MEAKLCVVDCWPIKPPRCRGLVNELRSTQLTPHDNGRRSAIDGRTTCWVCGQPACPQADRRSLRLDQHRCRAQEHQGPGARAGWLGLHFRCRRLHHGAIAKPLGRDRLVARTVAVDKAFAGRCRIVRRRPPSCGAGYTEPCERKRCIHLTAGADGTPNRVAAKRQHCSPRAAETTRSRRPIDNANRC